MKKLSGMALLIMSSAAFAASPAPAQIDTDAIIKRLEESGALDKAIDRAIERYTSRQQETQRKQQAQVVAGNSARLEKMRRITSADHIRGNSNAPVKIVEYSDLECPFCKSFHLTMQKVVNEYGKNGTVAWVYRHFPLDAIHSKARTEAAAAECAGELGGNNAFWAYIDRFYAVTLSNNQTNIQTVLPQIAREIGLDESKFNSCLASGKYDKHIQEDLNNAVATGGNGTPWSIVVTKSRKKYPLSGAVPYETLKQLIELALQNK